MKVLILVFLIAGCATSQPESFVLLDNGEPVICQHYEQAECGMTLEQCGTDKSVSFECAKNVKYVAPASMDPLPVGGNK